jgi:hypothetical protein
LAGTYDALNGVLVYVTPIAETRGFTVGQNLPPPSRNIDNYYVIVTVGGDIGPDGPGQVSQASDWWICQAEQGTTPVWFLIDYEYSAVTAENVSVTPISGIENAKNVQLALETIELQVQDRIEFIRKGSDGLTIDITAPEPTSYDGTTATITLDYASVDDRGIVQLTNDITGASQTIAPTQYAISQLNAKVEALVGSSILAGTYNSNTGVMVTVTSAGAAHNFVAGQQAPTANLVPDNYYIIVIVGGGNGPPGAVLPPTGVQSGDWFIVQKDVGVDQWVCIDYDNRTVDATQVNLTPFGQITATNVQTGMEQIYNLLGDAVEDVESLNDGIKVTQTGPLVSIELQPASSTDIGGVFLPPNDGLELTPQGGIYLVPATETTLGGIKVGENLTIEADGTLNAQGGGPSTGSSFYPVDDISARFDGTTVSFALTSSGKPVNPNIGPYNLFITVGGVLQSPDVAYTFTSGLLNFTEAPPPGAKFNGRYLDATGVLPDPAPPFVTASGYITGDVEVGATLSYVEPLFTGYPVPIVTWEWYRDSEATGTISKGYELTNADIGRRMSVKALLTNDSGTAQDTTAPTDVVKPPGGDVSFTVEVWGGKGNDANFAGNQAFGGKGAYQKVDMVASGGSVFTIGSLAGGSSGAYNGGPGTVFYIDNNWMVVAGGGGGFGSYRRWSGDSTYSFNTTPGKDAQSGYSASQSLGTGTSGGTQTDSSQAPEFQLWVSGGGGGGCPGGQGGGGATSSQPGTGGGSNIRCFADGNGTSGRAAGIADMTWVTGQSGVVGPTTVRITNKANGRFKDFGASATEYYIAEILSF